MTERAAGAVVSVVPLDRVKAFTDGVLAIVITILVLELEGPEEGITRADVPAYLDYFKRQLHPYVASFVLIGTFWMQHAVLLKHVRRCDRGFAWLNTLFMLPLSLLPFLTGLRVTHPAACWRRARSGLRSFWPVSCCCGCGSMHAMGIGWSPPA